MRIRLIHWNKVEKEQRAAALRRYGYQVEAGPVTPADLRQIRQDPPAAIVIDLTRLPSHGRDVGLAFRQTKGTRQVPLLFVEGEPQKVERIRQLLPDAAYTTWGAIHRALRQAIAHPAVDPVVPSSILAGYSGVPLAKKLGIKPGFRVALVIPPHGFAQTLGNLPKGAEASSNIRRRRDLTICFLRSRRELEARREAMVRWAAVAPLWIAWPKQASGMKTDLTQAAVRKSALAAGLVDYKICAIDATWSGLLFTYRGKGKGAI